jgi:hypothetical protein
VSAGSRNRRWAPLFPLGQVFDDGPRTGDRRRPIPDVRSLIASVAKGYPVGAPLTLQSGGEVKFKPRLIEGVLPKSVEPSELLLDGQQRMTSLYQVAFSKAPVRTRTDKKVNPKPLLQGLLQVDLIHPPAVANQRRHVQRPSDARIQSGDGRGARPGFASADRVDRELQVTHCTGPDVEGGPMRGYEDKDSVRPS